MVVVWSGTPSPRRASSTWQAAVTPSLHSTSSCSSENSSHACWSPARHRLSVVATVVEVLVDVVEVVVVVVGPDSSSPPNATNRITTRAPMPSNAAAVIAAGWVYQGPSSPSSPSSPGSSGSSGRPDRRGRRARPVRRRAPAAPAAAPATGGTATVGSPAGVGGVAEDRRRTGAGAPGGTACVGSPTGGVPPAGGVVSAVGPCRHGREATGRGLAASGSGGPSDRHGRQAHRHRPDGRTQRDVSGRRRCPVPQVEHRAHGVVADDEGAEMALVGTDDQLGVGHEIDQVPGMVERDHVVGIAVPEPDRAPRCHAPRNPSGG